MHWLYVSDLRWCLYVKSTKTDSALTLCSPMTSYGVAVSPKANRKWVQHYTPYSAREPREYPCKRAVPLKNVKTKTILLRSSTHLLMPGTPILLPPRHRHHSHVDRNAQRFAWGKVQMGGASHRVYSISGSVIFIMLMASPTWETAPICQCLEQPSCKAP